MPVGAAAAPGLFLPALGYRGLRSGDASARLSLALRGVLSDDARRIALEAGIERGHVLRRQLLSRHHAPLLVAAVCLIAGYGYGADADAPAGDSSMLVAGLAVLLGVALDVALVFARLHRLRWEVHGRITDSLLEFERAALGGGALSAAAAAAAAAAATAAATAAAAPPPAEGAADLPGISSADLLAAAASSAGAVITESGVVAGLRPPLWEALDFNESSLATHALPVFRDDEWVRLPVTLLVRGDLIALTNKENAPTKFDERDGRLLGRRGSTLRQQLAPLAPQPPSLPPPLQDSVPPAEGSAAPTAAAIAKVRENDIDALTLVGDMRRYVLRDTVARAMLQRRLRTQPKPQPLLLLQVRAFSRLAELCQIAFVAVLVAVIVVRSVVTDSVPDAAGGHNLNPRETGVGRGGFVGLVAGLLFQTPALLLTLSPVTLPCFLLFMEAVGTARLLAVHEAALLRSRWKEWKKSLLTDLVRAGRGVQRGQGNGEAEAEASSLEVQGAAAAASGGVAMQAPLRSARLPTSLFARSNLEEPSQAASALAFGSPDSDSSEDSSSDSDGDGNSDGGNAEGDDTAFDDPLARRGRAARRRTRDERQAADMWLPERKAPGAGLHRLLRLVQKQQPEWTVRNQDQSRALAHLRCARPDVGSLDDRGEFVPLQYAAPYSAQPTAVTVVSDVGGSVGVGGGGAGCLAAAASAAAGRHRVFDGPLFSQISGSHWRDVPLSRQLYYLRRILQGQALSVVRPTPLPVAAPVAEASVSPPWLFSVRGAARAVCCCYRRLAAPTSDPLAPAGAARRRGEAVAEDPLVLLQQRWRNGVLRDDLIDVGFGLRPVETPLLSSQLFVRLGVTTVFCCADRNTVCETEPTVENVMLLKGQSGSVFVDLHRDESSETGIRFNDNHWRNHLPALKPVGLARLL